MPLLNASGTTLTKGSFPATTASVPPGEVVMVITNDVFETFKYADEANTGKFGTGKRLKWRAGQRVFQSDIDTAYEAATISTVSPATGGAAGGTVVTITGTNFDGAAGVTFGGTAGTAFSVLSPTQVRVTTPAKSAGAYNVVVQDDSGNATKTNGFSFS